MQTFPPGLRIANSVATLQGADDALAAINTSQYSNGAIVLVRATGTLYRLNKTSTQTEDSPDVIAPDQGGPGRWFSLGSGAGQFQDVSVFHAAIPPQSSVESSAFTVQGALSSTDIVVYNLTDSTFTTVVGVVTGPVRITGTESATMRFLNATAATVAAATVSYRMAVLDG